MELSKKTKATFEHTPYPKVNENVLKSKKRRESIWGLEAEETKGFVDLGFVFTEEDLDTELPEILPGLRTFLCREEEERRGSVTRPYLSEAWGFYKGKEKDSIVIDLRMAALCGEKEMKDSLKWWARSLASNLKYFLPQLVFVGNVRLV